MKHETGAPGRESSPSHPSQLPAWLSPSSESRVPTPEDAVPLRRARVNHDHIHPFLCFCIIINSVVKDLCRTRRQQASIFCILGLPALTSRSAEGSRSGPPNMINRSQTVYHSSPAPSSTWRFRLEHEQRNGRGSKQISMGEPRQICASNSRLQPPSGVERGRASRVMSLGGMAYVGWDADAGNVWFIQKYGTSSACLPPSRPFRLNTTAATRCVSKSYFITLVVIFLTAAVTRL